MFKIGDKVCIPKTKSVGVSLSRCGVIERAKCLGVTFFCIASVSGQRYAIDTFNAVRSGSLGGIYFLAKDLELYNPEEDYIGGVVDG